MRKVLVVVGILIVVGLGLMVVSNMTGNVITGSTAGEFVVEEESFRIDEFGSDEEELNESLEEYHNNRSR